MGTAGSVQGDRTHRRAHRFTVTHKHKSLEKEMASHSRILAWKSPWAEEPGRVQSVGSQRVRHGRVIEHTAHKLEYGRTAAASAKHKVAAAMGPHDSGVLDPHLCAIPMASLPSSVNSLTKQR